MFILEPIEIEEKILRPLQPFHVLLKITSTTKITCPFAIIAEEDNAFVLSLQKITVLDNTVRFTLTPKQEIDQLPKSKRLLVIDENGDLFASCVVYLSISNIINYTTHFCQGPYVRYLLNQKPFLNIYVWGIEKTSFIRSIYSILELDFPSPSTAFKITCYRAREASLFTALEFDVTSQACSIASLRSFLIDFSVNSVFIVLNYPCLNNGEFLVRLGNYFLPVVDRQGNK